MLTCESEGDEVVAIGGRGFKYHRPPAKNVSNTRRGGAKLAALRIRNNAR